MAEGMVARVGQWCFRRRWWVVAIWVLAVVGGVFAAGPVFRGLTGGGGPSSMESIQANQVLSGNTNMGGMVTAVIDGIDPKAGAVTDTVRAAAGDLGGISGVVSVSTPYDPGLPPARAAALVSRDNHAILVTIQLAKLDKLARHDAAAAVGTRLHKLGDALVSAGQTGAQVRVGGGAALGQQVNDAVQKDLARAEEISLPITLVVLVFVFGGLIAAGLPASPRSPTSTTTPSPRSACWPWACRSTTGCCSSAATGKSSAAATSPRWPSPAPGRQPAAPSSSAR